MTYLTITAGESIQEKIEILSTPSNCGLLFLIDQLLKKAKKEKRHQRIRTCKLAEKLLSNYQKTTVVVSPTISEYPAQFVQECIAKASQINSSLNAHHGIMKTFACNLLSYLNNIEETSSDFQTKLIRAWKDFSSHWLRDEIHHVLVMAEE